MDLFLFIPVSTVSQWRLVDLLPPTTNQRGSATAASGGCGTSAGGDQAVLDGELFSGDGAEGIDAILVGRQQVGGDVAFAAFVLLGGGP